MSDWVSSLSLLPCVKTWPGGLAASCKTDGPHCNHRASAVIERQVDSEHDVTSIAVQVYREINQVCAQEIVTLHPADLRGSQPSGLSII